MLRRILLAAIAALALTVAACGGSSESPSTPTADKAVRVSDTKSSEDPTSIEKAEKLHAELPVRLLLEQADSETESTYLLTVTNVTSEGVKDVLLGLNGPVTPKIDADGLEITKAAAAFPTSRIVKIPSLDAGESRQVTVTLPAGVNHCLGAILQVTGYNGGDSDGCRVEPIS